MDKTEMRKKRIIDIIYLAIVLGLAYLFFKYFFWMFFPFLFAFFIAVLVQKPANFISGKTKLNAGVLKTVFVILLLLVVLALVSLLGVRIIGAGKSFAEYLRTKLSDLPSLIENVRRWSVSTLALLPDSVEKRAAASVNGWFDFIREKSAGEIASIIVDTASGGKKISVSSFTTPLSGIWSTAKQIPSMFVAFLITVLSSCFMATDYDLIVGFIKKQLSGKNAEKLSKSKKIVFSSIGKLIRSYAIIILVTFTELAIGLNILKLTGIYSGGHVFGICAIIALLDILPVLGTGTFMVPWIVYSLITDKTSLAVGLLIVYVVIYLVRQVLEPKIVGGTVGLPAFMTLMAMYVGSQLFGVAGIFLLPIMVIIVKLLNDEGVISIWTPSDREPEEKEKKPFFERRMKKKSK